MIDVVLLIVRLLFVALLYLFLFAIMKTGIGLVRGQRKKERTWNLSVEKGPKELRGVSIVVRGPVIRGPQPRSRHRGGCRIPCPAAMRVSSLWGRTCSLRTWDPRNGTGVNGQPITEPTALRNNDVVNVGDVAIRVRFA